MIKFIKVMSMTLIFGIFTTGLSSCLEDEIPRHKVTFGYTLLAQEHLYVSLPTFVNFQENQFLLSLINSLKESDEISIKTNSESRFQGYKFLYRISDDKSTSLMEITITTVMPQYDITIYLEAVQTHRQVTANFENNLRAVFANSFNFSVIENTISNIEIVLPLEKVIFDDIEQKITDIIMTNITLTAPSRDNFYITFSNNLINDNSDVVIKSTLQAHFFTIVGEIDGMEADFSKLRIETPFNDNYISNQITNFFNNVLLKVVDFNFDVCRVTRVIKIIATSR